MALGTWTIQQEITAGNDFAKADPDGTETISGRKINYDDCTSGGKFDFGWDRPLEVRRILLDLGDATDWHLHIRSDTVDSNQDFVAYERGDFEQNTITITGSDFLLLFPGDALLVETTGASQKMYAEVSIEPKS